MTTIAAIQGDSWAVIGADSQVTEENKKYQLPERFSKLVEVGAYYIGIAGDLRAVNVLKHNFRPPAPKRMTVEQLDKFMVSRFVPKLKSCFDVNFYGKDSEHGSSLMVAVHGIVYEVGSDYDCIRDDRGLYSIGSGSQFALGALSALDSTTARTLGAAKEMVSSALSAAALYDSGTSKPITIVVQAYS
jgi:ATP-dependent protease HslVU (ClpYQ) peptidase subunit